MKNNYSFYTESNTRKKRSILYDKEQFCGADGIEWREGAFFPCDEENDYAVLKKSNAGKAQSILNG